MTSCNAPLERDKEAAIDEQFEILTEQLNVATSRAQRFRECLLRLAARADDYSAADIRAHIADALEMSVKELEALLETE